MRLNIRKSIITGISLATLLPAFSLLQSCDDSEAEKWVDLRYRVEDSYLWLKRKIRNQSPSRSSQLTRGKYSENMIGTPSHPVQVRQVRPTP